MALRISLAGQVGIEHDGTAIEGAALGRLGRLSLAYLTAERHRPITHAELADVLWGDDLPGSWEQLVRGLVAKLRAAFRDVGLAPTEVLTTGFGCYQLHLPPMATVDVEDVVAAVEASAAALAGGDYEAAQSAAVRAVTVASVQFVPGGVGPWVERRQAELRELHLRALEALADAAIGARRFGAAVSAAEDAIVLQPFRESAYNRLMRAHAAAGNRSDSLSAYDRCRRALAEELGVNPSSTTEAAYVELLGSAPAAVTADDERRVTARLPLPAGLSNPGEAGFVGREEELANLEAAFARARHEGAQCVLVAGEPGIGKSRLAAETSRVLHALGARVLHGRCDDELGVPYQPFAEALRHYVEHAPEAELAAHVAVQGNVVARLVPELSRRLTSAPPPPPVDEDTDRYRLFEAVLAMLAAAADQAPLFLVLDDLHWAAKPTLLLLRHLIRSNTHAPIVVFGAYRDNELSWSHPLAELLADLRHSGRVERLLLWGLEPDAVEAMVKQVERDGRLRADERLAARLSADTDGNPFFIGELLRHFGESSDPEASVPESVREVLRQRLARLAPLTQRALSAAAVAGDHFALPVIERTLGEDGDVLAALEEAVRARLVTESPPTPGGFRFAHALVRHALYEDLGRARRARLHAAVGRALASFGSAAGDEVVPLAYHFCQAVPEVDAAVAADYAAGAAQWALDQLAYEDAIRHAEQGIAALDRAAAADHDRRCTLALLLAAARMRVGENDAMRQACLVAAEEARALGDGDRFARAVAMHNFLLPPTLKELGAELTREALSGLDDHASAVRVQVMAAHACDLATHRDPDAESASREVLRLARLTGDREAIWRALLVVSCALFGSPRVHERLAIADELLARSARGWHQGHGYRIRAMARFVAGDLTGYDADLRSIAVLGEELRVPVFGHLVRYSRAVLASLEGSFEEIETPEAGPPGSPQLFEVRRVQGRLAEWLPAPADDAFHADALPDAQLALRDAMAGNTSSAAERVAAFAGNGFAAAEAWVRPHILAYLSEAAAVLEDRSAAARLAPLLLPYAGQLIGPIVCPGPADRYLGILATTQRGWAEGEAYFEGAIALEARLGLPLLRARTCIWYARMLLARDGSGDRPRAGAMLRSVLTMTAELDAAGLRADAAQLLGEP